MNTYSIFDLFPSHTIVGEPKQTGVLGVRGVRIPAIQREYVQGRDDLQGTKVRVNFIPALFNAALSREEKTLHYVYGSIQNELFRPLDGQQRLTTLYLFAWLCGKVKDNWIFEYESRRAAEFFMRGLRRLVFKIEDGISPRELISTTDWYLPVWDEDPSVGGMMRMLDFMYHELMSINESGKPKYPDKNFDLTRIRFSFKNIEVEDKSYSQIYLKMNARGIPLTGWEKLKAILDSYVPNSMQVEWKKNVDGQWSEGIWNLLAYAHYDEKAVKEDDDKYEERTGKQRASYLSDVLEKIVRTASVCSLGMPYDFPLYELNERLHKASEDVRVLFYSRCRCMLVALSGEREFALSWTNERSENSLWTMSTTENDGGRLTTSFCKWLVARADHSYARLVRLLMLSTYFCADCEKRKKRKLRSFLNILDATKVESDTERMSALVAEGEHYLHSEDGGVVTLKTYNSDMVLEEMSKARFDEKVIRDVELDNLVVEGDTRFLAWSPYDSEDDLTERLAELHSKIKSDWLSFYADLINNLEYDNDERTVLKDKSIIPFGVAADWGKEVFHKKQFSRALAKLSTFPEHRDYSFWVKHLMLLIKEKKLGANRAIKYTNDWMFVMPAEKLSPYAIRLDWSAEEAHNRDRLKGGMVLFGNKDSRWLPRESIVDGEYYRVWDDDWYETMNPSPCDRDGNALK